MSTIKEILETFCRILSSAGFVKLKAEDLRRAKFADVNDALIDSLWTLIIQILSFKRNGIYSMAEAPTYNEKEECLEKLKIRLLCHGIEQFNNSTVEMSSIDLLVIIGSLLVSEQVMETITACCFNSTLHFLSVDSPTEPIFDENHSYKYDQVDLLRLNLRKAELNVRAIANARRCIMRRLMKIIYFPLSKSNQINQDKINSNELQFRNQLLFSLELFTSGRNFSESLSFNNQVIDDLIVWHAKGAHIFWKWMESVLNLSLDNHNNSENYTSEQTNHSSIDLAIKTVGTQLCNTVEISRSFCSQKLLKEQKVIFSEYSIRKSINPILPIFLQDKFQYCLNNSSSLETHSKDTRIFKEHTDKLTYMVDQLNHALGSAMNSDSTNFRFLKNSFISLKPFP